MVGNKYSSSDTDERVVAAHLIIGRQHACITILFYSVVATLQAKVRIFDQGDHLVPLESRTTRMT